MLAYFAPLDRTVPTYPIAVPTVATLSADELRGQLLDEFDSLIGDLAAALAERDSAARKVTLLEHRITLARAALQGQTPLLPA